MNQESEKPLHAEDQTFFEDHYSSDLGECSVNWCKKAGFAKVMLYVRNANNKYDKKWTGYVVCFEHIKAVTVDRETGYLDYILPVETEKKGGNWENWERLPNSNLLLCSYDSCTYMAKWKSASDRLLCRVHKMKVKWEVGEGWRPLSPFPYDFVSSPLSKWSKAIKPTDLTIYGCDAAPNCRNEPMFEAVRPDKYSTYKTERLNIYLCAEHWMTCDLDEGRAEIIPIEDAILKAQASLYEKNSSKKAEKYTVKSEARKNRNGSFWEHRPDKAKSMGVCKFESCRSTAYWQAYQRCKGEVMVIENAQLCSPHRQDVDWDVDEKVLFWMGTGYPASTKGVEIGSHVYVPDYRCGNNNRTNSTVTYGGTYSWPKKDLKKPDGPVTLAEDIETPGLSLEELLK